ncbi:MAG TPA: IS1634 family transposase [Thermoplasmata archaeon]|nr:IS1634 family transposase [Thermoplasmata archaeon]
MKSFIRVKNVGKYRYAYEITPYYDKKTKNTKQKSRYLGKCVDGKITTPRSKLPMCTFDYGEFLPFMKILDELAIGKILRSLLTESQANTILALALNRVVRPVAMVNVRSWYEGTYLSKLYGDIPLSSQSLSEFMARVVGTSTIPMEFSDRFIKEVGGGTPLLYDITSLSSTSRLMDVLEYGYNRDHEPLPQLNISMVAHKDLGIPLFFDIHPGSMVDITTLRNTIKKLNALGLKRPTMVLDRGFFSETNVNEMVDNGYDFIMPAAFTSKEVKSLISASRSDIEKGRHLVRYRGMTIFVKPIKLDIGNGEVDGFLFYDMKREQEEKERFYGQLYTVIERLKTRILKEWENPGRVFENISRELSGCIDWKLRRGRFAIKVGDKAVSQHVNRMGFTVILQRGNHGWEEVLGWTRERDAIEKMFKQLKNDIEAKPLRAHKTEVAKGWIFVTFLSLIMRSRLTRMLKETELIKDYSIPSLLLELSKLKKVELSDGSIIITEVTKRQRKIFKDLDINP